MLERLKIMHDLVRDENYSVISKEEITGDLDETLKILEENFKALLQYSSM
jgi:hypothetical protein